MAERLARLGALIALLEQVQSRGINVYRGDDDLRAATERRLQLAIQICIDDAKVFQSLGHLDDLRAFAAAIQRIVDADG